MTQMTEIDFKEPGHCNELGHKKRPGTLKTTVNIFHRIQGATIKFLLSVSGFYDVTV